MGIVPSGTSYAHFVHSTAQCQSVLRSQLLNERRTADLCRQSNEVGGTRHKATQVEGGRTCILHTPALDSPAEKVDGCPAGRRVVMAFIALIKAERPKVFI